MISVTKWKVCLLIAGLSLSNAAVAIDSVPAGPPWNETCDTMDVAGFSMVFRSKSCEATFESVFAASSAEVTLDWMKENRSCIREWGHFSWLAFSRLDKKMARLGWLYQVFQTQLRLSDPGGESVVDLLTRGLTGKITSDGLEHTKAFLDGVETNQAFAPSMKKALDAAGPICAYYLNFQCKNAMTDALNWMYPRSYSITTPMKESFTFSMVPFYRDVFSDSKTMNYASSLALFLYEKIERGDLRQEDNGSFYEIALKHFAGDQDRFWKFAVVYSTRGAAWATAYQLAHPETKPLFASFMVISAAMGYLDVQMHSENRTFSYTDSVGESTCYQPKPYHYWMAGGFSYFLHKKGYTANTSILVARLLGALYEVGSTTQGRDPDEVFFSPTYSHVANRARRELTHHFYGARLGVAPESTKIQEFDDRFGDLMNRANPLPDYSEDEMKQAISNQRTRWKLWTELMPFNPRN